MWCVALFITALAWLVWTFDRRTDAADQIQALLHEDGPDAGGPEENRATIPFPRERIGYIVSGAVLAPLSRSVLITSGVAEHFAFAALGALAGEMMWRRSVASKARKNVRAMEFHLPMAMEQIVMAVGAGLDVLPAIAEASRNRSDPISQLLTRVAGLCEKGITLEGALRSTADTVKCPAVKHAFIHLALAHKEGGEIVRPLRELSDATQSYYQETVEEEIARLPVKAVLPLVVTFTGLIICFLTVPLIQVGSLTSKVSNATTGR
jgi:Flp pilus assembly protein TadB